MRSWFLLFSLLLSLAFSQSACDLREGTLVYDVDFHPANANAGTEGSSLDGAGNITTINKFGAGYQLSESNGNSSATESGTEDTLSIKLTIEPFTNVTLALVSVDTGEVTLSTNTLNFTADNWNVVQTLNLNLSVS